MQKTKLGISVGLIGALLYLCGFFGGYLATLLLAGYVLLFEENAWLKKTSVRTILLLVGFSLIYALLGLLPDLIDVVNSVFNVFGGYFSIGFITNVIAVFRNIFELAEKIVFLLLGIMAFSQSNVRIPLLDDMIDKHMN